MKINAAWHMENKMPKNPTLHERLDWHIEHAKNCNCQPVPEKLQKQIDGRG